MDVGLALAIALALAFAATNGIHDAANAIAALVATRAARPRQAIIIATVFNFAGPLVVGAAVADTIGGIVTVDPAAATEVIGAGLAGAVAWGLHPVGVLGTLVALAISPVLGGGVAVLGIRGFRRLARRATSRIRSPINAGQWVMSAGLAFSHGANDAQKAVGIVAALLLASGHLDSLNAPLWVTASCSLALTLGTAIGGWRIIQTVGRRIYRLKPAEGLVTESSSAAVIFGASLLGAPTSTSQVVASAVVGAGAGRRRWHHINWLVVRQIALAWLITLPSSAALAIGAYGILQVVR
jgi:PiT family inorganic phosphate transporter